jgi:branched-chain amino acid transport system permease protein
VTELLQFAFSGLTVGAVYALVALGFTLIYNSCDVINFAQGEFVMLGGMTTVFLGLAGVPLPLAACLAVVLTVAVGLALHRFAIEPARDSGAVVLIIITIGASIFLRGAAQVIFDKRFHTLPPFVGGEAIRVAGAAILPQSLVVLAGAVIILVLLCAFIERTLIGAVAGILITPVALTSYDVGTLLALKGFAAAMLGGIGSAVGAVVGGLVLGLLEAYAAGYVSSQYKDAVAFLVILIVLLAMPRGLFGRAPVERV